VDAAARPPQPVTRSAIAAEPKSALVGGPGRNYRRRTTMIEAIMHRLKTILALTLLAGLTACNTAAGIGKDVSAAGHAVTNGAEKVKNGL
jgi:predicted small secreted protein